MEPQQEPPWRGNPSKDAMDRVANVESANWEGQNNIYAAAKTMYQLSWSNIAQKKTCVVV